MSTVSTTRPTKRRSARRLGLLGGVIVVLLLGGVAFAARLANGTGLADGDSTVAVDSTISAASPGAALYPGGSGQYTISISNPNPYPVVVVTISPSASPAIDACGAGTMTSPGVSNPPGVIEPNSSADYKLTATMIADPDNSCQGKSFSMPLSVQLAAAGS